MSNIQITKIYCMLSIIGFIGSWLLIAVGTYLFGNLKLYEYLTPLVVIMSVAVFVQVRYWFENDIWHGINRCISVLRMDLFGVYLIHAFYLNLIPSLWFTSFRSLGWLIFVLIPIYSVFIMFMSLISIRLLRKIPYVKFILQQIIIKREIVF